MTNVRYSSLAHDFDFKNPGRGNGVKQREAAGLGVGRAWGWELLGWERKDQGVVLGCVVGHLIAAER